MNTFAQYLTLHKIDVLRLASQAKVRYLTVYNVQKGNPITTENALKLKEAVYRMTGIPYNGTFSVRNGN